MTEYISEFDVMYLLPILPVINKWNKIDKSIFPATNCTAITIFDENLNCTLSLPRLTKFIRDLTYLNSKSLDILVGILLGDAYFKKGKNGVNVRIGFKQSIINFPFLWTVYTELAHYFASLPRFDFAIAKGKKYGQVILETRSYPVLNQLYDIFIVNGVKIISKDLFDLLTPRALAYWIMSDGVSNQYGLTICTDCFTVQEVVTLINILIIRYNLNCSIHYLRGNPRLYIKASSMENLRQLVLPRMIPFSQYKLYKGKRFVN